MATFTDRVHIDVSAGKGGNGVVAWRREKYIPKGGPTGGCGGKGGSIIFEADSQIYSLEYYRNRRILKAENGVSGGPNNRTGRNGRDLILKVPCGTLVKDRETGEVVHDFTEDKEQWTPCCGGKGGRGNQSFKTPTNRAPNICTPGELGQAAKYELELKLIADVGLVGFPNAGKSTLICALAYLKVKIAPYPFTTLQPNLGFIQCEDRGRIFIADIPGIIKGAHENKGLGFQFLRHIERTQLLLFVLDASGIDGRDPWNDYLVLQHEIERYNPEMLTRPSLIVLNKIDTEEAKENIKMFKENYTGLQENLFEISAEQRMGLQPLLAAIERESPPRKS